MDIRSITRVCIWCFLTLFAFNSYAQTKYWIFFQDKPNIPSRDWLDAPVHTSYVDSLRAATISIVKESKWLNAVSCIATEEQLTQVKTYSFVHHIQQVASFEPSSKPVKGIVDTVLPFALVQMNAKAFSLRDIRAKGVKIGIADAGFTDADSNHFFTHVFKNQRVKAFRDFLDTVRTDKYQSITKGDYHGREVFKMIGGLHDSLPMRMGMATEAEYYLARTENGDKEQRIEEDNWIAAIEWFDALGVKLVNTSLGYSIGFTDSTENHSIKDMDGKTTAISKAAEIAVTQRKMILIISAGNSGNDADWRIVSAPGDAQSAISVGATQRENRGKIGYSSIGADFVDFIKPDVACYSPNGTSFSAPAMCGFVACMLQMDSTLSPSSVKSILAKASHLYPYPNNYIGYGVPDAKKAITLIKDTSASVHKSRMITTNEKKIRIPLSGKPSLDPVVFHKKNAWVVSHQVVLKPKKFKEKVKKKHKERIQLKGKTYYAVVKRSKGISYSTVDAIDEVIEIVWQ